MIEANGVELCAEAFGDPAHTRRSCSSWGRRLDAVVGGGFCRMPADGGRFVIRYEHRDTGRSVSSEPGRPGYRGADLLADAAGVLDAYGIPAAHVVGVSAGGAFAQLLALDFPEIARRHVERARDFRAAHNHDLLHDESRSREPLSSISFPTLVIHGTVDPLAVVS